MTSSSKSAKFEGVDAVLEAVGSVGRYQKFQAFLLSLSNFTVAFHLLNFVFIAQQVGHICDTAANSESLLALDNTTNLKYERCSVRNQGSLSNTTSISCAGWNYSAKKGHSIVSEWDLVCGQVVFSRLPQSLFIVGQGVGAVVFSNLSDKFGRYPFVIITQILTAAAGVALAFAPSISVFSVLRLLNGIFQQGIVVTSITLLLENFTMNRRVEAAVVYGIFWSFAVMSLTLFAYLMRDHTWRIMQLSFCAVTVTVILDIIFLRESLRWLVINKKTKKALRILNIMGKMNKSDVSAIRLPEVHEISEPDFSITPPDKEKDTVNDHMYTITKADPARSTAETDFDTATAKSDYSCLDLLRTRFMRKVTVAVWISWWVDSLTYFSLYLTASSLVDNLYLNFFLNSLAEVPAVVLYLLVGRRLGRRRFFIIFHTIAGVFLLAATAVRSLPDNNAASVAGTVLGVIGKVGNTACFNGMFIYVAEVYPTNLRTVGVGAGSTANRVGGAIAPFVSMLAAAVSWAPGVIFGLACLITAGINTLFPEAEGKELPRTIAEVQHWKRNGKTK